MKYLCLLSCLLIVCCSENTVAETDSQTAIQENSEKTSETSGQAKSTANSQEEKKPYKETNKVKENLYNDLFDPDFISGRWEAADSEGFSFSLWFYVEDGYVSGQYCAKNEDASRIDCGTEDKIGVCSIMGPYIADAKSLELEFVSCYAMKKGKASISPYGDGGMIWKLTSSPGEFGIDHFAPQTALLNRISFDPFD